LQRCQVKQLSGLLSKNEATAKMRAHCNLFLALGSVCDAVTEKSAREIVAQG